MGKTYLVNLTEYEIECLFRVIRNKQSDLGLDTEKTLISASSKLIKAMDGKKVSQKAAPSMKGEGE